MVYAFLSVVTLSAFPVMVYLCPDLKFWFWYPYNRKLRKLDLDLDLDKDDDHVIVIMTNLNELYPVRIKTIEDRYVFAHKNCKFELRVNG
jgi:magnesium-transporting ATPase (P-type)